MSTLAEVKAALGITGDYQDSTLTVYYNEVVDFIRNAGIADANITSGIVARGVSDLWNYGGAEGTLSEYFIQRVSQLAYKK